MSQIQSNSKPGQLIVERINKIRHQIRVVELVTTLVTLLACLLAFLLVSVLVDHWLFKNGTPLLLRYLGGFVFGGGAAAYFVLRLIPILRFAINPAYAAEVLEKNHPDMKNRLVNWVFLRRENRNKTSPGSQTEHMVIDRIGRETAANLKAIPEQLVVDCAAMIRWGIVLVVVLGLFCLYMIVSPKNTMQSVARAVTPFVDIEPPQSIVIKAVEPGDITAYQGETVQVKTRLDRATNKPVHLVYSTADQRLVDQRVPMQGSDDGMRFECRFPPGKKGFEESVTYRIEVGDGRSQNYTVTVKPSITIDVKSVEYRYPKYTNLATQTVESSGDLRAVEGTQVTINAKSNIAMSRAILVPDNDATRAIRLNVSPSKTEAQGTLTLAFEANQPTKPVCMSYTLRCWDDEQRTNPLPSVYRVEVLRDEAPIVRWADSHSDDEPLQVALNEAFDVIVEARDPDFGLQSLQLRGTVTRAIDGAVQREGNVLPETNDLPLEKIELLKNPPRTGTVTIKKTLVPSKLGLRPGDRVSYFAEATDTKEPEANSSATPSRVFVVADINPDKPLDPPVDDEPQEQDEQNPDQGDQGKNQSDKQQQNGNNSGEQNQSDKENGESEQSGDSEKGQSDGTDAESGRDDNQRPSQNEGDASDQTQQNTGGETNQGDRQSNDTQSNDSQPQQRSREQQQGNEQNQEGDKNQNGDMTESGDQNGASGTGQQNQNGGQASNNSNGDSNQQSSGGEQQPDHGSNTGNVGQAEHETGNSNQSSQQSDRNQQGNQPQGPNGQQRQSQSGQGDQTGRQNNASENAGTQNGRQGQNRKQPIDGESNPGDVINEVLDHMREKGKWDGNNNRDDQSNDDNGNNRNQTDQQEQRDQQGTPNQAETQSQSQQGQRQEQRSGQTPEQRPEHDDTQPGGNQTDTYHTQDGYDPNAEELAPNDDKPIYDGPNDSGQNATEASSPGREMADDQSQGTSPRGENARDVGANDTEKTGRNGQPSTNEASDNSQDQSPNDRTNQPNGNQTNNRQQNQTGANEANGNRPEPERDGASNVGQQDASTEGTQPQANPSQEPGNARRTTSNENMPPATGGQSQRPDRGETPDGFKEASPVPDEVNLDDTRQATDLALRYIEDELGKESPDQQLLDRLGGWDQNDLRRFVDRWREMQQQAERSPGTNADRKFDEALRNLGNLTPKATVRMQQNPRQGARTTTTEAQRYAPPSGKYENLMKAYTEGINK